MSIDWSKNTDEDRRGDERRSEVSGKLAGQEFNIKAGNTQMLVILLVTLITTVFAFALYKHHTTVTEQTEKQTEAMLLLAKAINDNNIAVQRKFVVLTYVLTRDEKQRRELRLEKPQELRDMER